LQKNEKEKLGGNDVKGINGALRGDVLAKTMEKENSTFTRRESFLGRGILKNSSSIRKEKDIQIRGSEGGKKEKSFERP